MKIATKDRDGRPNGYVIPIWNVLDEPGYQVKTVYMTTVEPGMMKGPHLHKRRSGRFFCAHGNVRVVTRHAPNRYGIWLAEEGSTILVPALIAAALYNVDKITPAKLINLTNEPWDKNDPDEHPVEDWPEFIWS